MNSYGASCNSAWKVWICWYVLLRSSWGKTYCHPAMIFDLFGSHNRCNYDIKLCNASRTSSADCIQNNITGIFSISSEWWMEILQRLCILGWSRNQRRREILPDENRDLQHLHGILHLQQQRRLQLLSNHRPYAFVDTNIGCYYWCIFKIFQLSKKAKSGYF